MGKLGIFNLKFEADWDISNDFFQLSALYGILNLCKQGEFSDGGTPM